MAADTFSNFLGLLLQGTGNNNNAWGAFLNGSALQTLEKAVSGNISRAVTGGTLDLSGSPPPAAATQALEMVQIFTGALVSHETVIMPNLSKTWYIFNNTTGAFQLFIKTTAGNAIQIPQGTGKFVMCDGSNNILRHDQEAVGDFVHYGGSSRSGALVANGASLLRADYPNLFARIGTTFGSVDGVHFTLPNLSDTNRYLRAAGGSLTAGTYQASQNKAHTHAGATFSGTTGTESVDHSHTGSGTTSVESATHTHPYTNYDGGAVNAGGGAGGVAGSGTTGTQSAQHTHTYSFTTSGRSATHTHTYSGTTGTIPSDGGAEARPESLAVNIGILF